MSVPTARAYAFRRVDEATQPSLVRAALAELISTFIFVLPAVGSIFALDKMYAHTGRPASGLLAVALASGLSLAAAMAASINVSGGHVNPAITFGALVGGRVSLIQAVYYWAAQLLGAIMAVILLRLVTDGMRPVELYLAAGEGKGHGMLLELVMTYGLVYTYYATAIDPRRGSMWVLAPLAVGLIFAANVLVGGPFDGAAMNPARAFGPALIEWRWGHHWIYWVGPLIGGALAGLIYEFLIIPIEAPHPTQQPLAAEDYQ